MLLRAEDKRGNKIFPKNIITILIFYFLAISFLVNPSRGLAQEGYYLPGKALIELKEVKEKGKVGNRKEPNEFQNETLQVFPEAEISTQDVEGIGVEKVPFYDVTNQEMEGDPVEKVPSFVRFKITLYFKREAWDKIRKKTARLEGKRLAILRDEKIYIAPEVRGFIIDQVSFSLSQKDTKIFIQGMKAWVPPVDRTDEKMKYLEKRIQKNPDDREATETLVHHYYYLKKDCQKAIHVLDNLIRLEPGGYETYFNIVTCYAQLQQYEPAIKILKKGIQNHDPQAEFLLRMMLGGLYIEQGNQKQALEEYQKSLILIYAIELFNPLEQYEGIEKISPNFFKEWVEKKKNMVQFLLAEIKKIKSPPQSEKKDR